MKLTFDVPEELAEKIGEEIKAALDEYKKSKPFPQAGDKFFFICANGVIGNDTFARYPARDFGMYNFGNCFRTKEEAEFKLEQLKVLHELEQLADDDQPWDDENKHFIIEYDNSLSELYVVYWRKAQTLPRTYYFKSIQSAEAAINKIGADRLKKYYFCIQEEEE